MANQRKIRLADFANYKILNEVQYYYQQILLAITHIDLKKNRTFSNLWMLAASGENCRQFTTGNSLDTYPRFSPNGEWVAFISDRGGKQQIHLIPTQGGEARSLTDLDGSFSSLTWSPDGKWLAFAFQHTELEDKRKAPRHIKKFYFKQDGCGLAPEDYWHIWIVEVETGRCRQLTGGEYNHASPCWSPDSQTIACIANRKEDAWLDVENTDIWLISLGQEELKQLTHEYGPVNGPAWSPDGRYLAYLGHRGGPGRDQIYNQHVWIIDLHSGECRDLCPELDRPCLNLILSDIVPGCFRTDHLIWENDGSALYTLVSDAGRGHIYRVPLTGGKPYPVTCGDMNIYSFAIEAKRLVFLASTPLSPGEIYSLPLRSAKSAPAKGKQLSRFNQELMDTLELREPEFVECQGVKTPVYGFLYHPPDFTPEQKYPFLMVVHGGPYVLYGSNFFHEMHCLAAQGFVVFCPNQGGSQGYGEKHASLIFNQWGEADYPELMQAVDDLLRRGYIDKSRLGVTGGSYGGFMTNWIITHSNRFAAAITQRCISEFISFFGSSDAGSYFKWELGGPPWKNWRAYKRWSPLFLVDKIKTPLLIIHSEGDHRTPIAQAEQLYLALRYEKKEVEMLYFPGESHNLSRNGLPSNRLSRLQAIVQWFSKYLKGGNPIISAKASLSRSDINAPDDNKRFK